MKIDECTPIVAHTFCVGFTSNAIPDTRGYGSAESLQTGVFTLNALCDTIFKLQRQDYSFCRSALRYVYKKVKTVFNYVVSKGFTVFYFSIYMMKLLGGKCKVISKSRFFNNIFIFSTDEQLNTFVYDNVNIFFLYFFIITISI